MSDLHHRFPVYSRFLRLFPAAYRQEYEEQILQTLADMLDDPARPNTLVWTRATLDFPLSVLRQQYSYTGGIMTHEVPNYVKRSALIGVALIVPFFIVITLNSMMGHGLPTSRLWQAFFLVLILGLPALAFALNTATFLIWSSDQHRKTDKGFFRNLLDVRHNWPMLATAGLGLLIALFIPFHDSTHCLTGNPVKEVRNFHQTVECIQRG